GAAGRRTGSAPPGTPGRPPARGARPGTSRGPGGPRRAAAPGRRRGPRRSGRPRGRVARARSSGSLSRRRQLAGGEGGLMARDLGQGLLELLEGAPPQHLHGRARAAHALGHVLEGEALEVAQDDDLLVVLGQPAEGLGDEQLALLAQEELAGALAAVGRVGGAGGAVAGAGQGDLAAGLALGRPAVLADE